MKLYWVETGNQLRLAIVPRPRGDDWLKDELDQMKRAGVDVLVSMLQVDEAAELGLSSEANLCEARGIVFRSFPIPDRETPPSTASFSRFVEDLRAETHAGRSVAVRQVGCANVEIKERFPLLHSHDGGGYVHIPGARAHAIRRASRG